MACRTQRRLLHSSFRLSFCFDLLQVFLYPELHDLAYQAEGESFVNCDSVAELRGGGTRFFNTVGTAIVPDSA